MLYNMRKLLLFIILFAAQGVARGQSDFELFYWFDEEENRNSKAMTQKAEIQLDIQHLNVGLHTLYMQIKDSCGNVSSPITRTFYRAFLNNQGLAMRYWFDGKESEQSTATGMNVRWKEDIDVSHLNVGLHTLYVQATYNTKHESSPLAYNFFRGVAKSDATNYVCWFDEDITTMQSGTYNNDIIWLDVSKLKDGFHTLYIQAVNNTATQVVVHNFIKVPQTEGNVELTCVVFIDDSLYGTYKIESQTGILNLDIDVASLSQGVHTLQTFVVTPSGVATNVSNHFFVRSTTDKELGNMKCYYSIDGNERSVMAGIHSNGTYHFDLDVTELEDGLHQLSYMLADVNGASTETRTTFFIKSPVGGNGIMQYEYWLNDNDSLKTTTKLKEHVDPLKLITLLPVESVPLRSSQFHFEVKEGAPTLYAKNTLNMRFFDATTRFVDFSREYIDYNVEQKIENIEELKTQQTFTRPGENSIKWFKFEAVYGDSIVLKSNTPVSIEIFNSNGNNLFATSGNYSMTEDGCLILEDGTFYVAVHNVTGNANEIVLSSKIIDKFAVFEYAPKAISSVGTTIVHLKGNGLNYVKDFKLHNGDKVLDADTIISNRIDLLARFKTTEESAPMGKYDMRINFSDDKENKEIVFDDALKVEATDRGEITIDIVTERRVADPYPIKVTLKNNGNVGYYSVPLNIAFAKADMIDEFEFINFDLLLSGSMCANKEFFTYTDNLLGKGIKGLFIPLLIPYLGPYEEQTLVFGVKTKVAHAKFDFYAWAGEPWYDSSMNYDSNKALVASYAKSRCTDSNIPDIYDGLDAADAANNLARRLKMPNLPISPASTVRPFIGTGEAVGGIIQGATRRRDDAVLRAAGLDPNDRANDQFRYKYRYCARSPQDIWDDANPFRRGTRKSINDYAESNCPNPNPHEVDVYIPGDPNEITGYVAESGSHYMTSDIMTINYDIEFENDPQIANSSAHVIIVENQLDTTKFKLDSFMPKEIVISGNKVELDGAQSFVKTIDLRPRIDALAELRCEYNIETGLAKWIFKSLNPMTMELTDDIMQGVLPINYDGTSGIGNITYSVDILREFPDNTEISNIASIIFDNNEPFVTPVWTNIIDNTAPVSSITSIEEISDSTILINWQGEDAGSGIYCYQLYAQPGIGAEWMPLLGDTLKTSSKFLYKRNIDFGFCIVATDSAGNVEAKELTREVEFKRIHIAGDADRSGEVNVLDINATLNYIMNGEINGYDILQMDSNEDGEVNLLDINETLGIILERERKRTSFPYREKHKVSKTLNTPVL